MTARPGITAKRRKEPWLFVEFIATAAWLKDGDTVQTIATRLQRPIPVVRALIFGDEA